MKMERTVANTRHALSCVTHNYYTWYALVSCLASISCLTRPQYSLYLRRTAVGPSSNFKTVPFCLQQQDQYPFRPPKFLGSILQQPCSSFGCLPVLWRMSLLELPSTLSPMRGWQSLYLGLRILSCLTLFGIVSSLVKS